MKLAVSLVLCVLFASAYCGVGVPANANVILVDENYDTTDQTNMIAACPSCTFTVVQNSLSDSPNYFDNPIDPNYDMLVYLKSDDDWDNYTPQSLTWKNNIETFANLGRVVLFTQYDMLASSTDDVLISLVGGSGSIDCSGYDGSVPDPYPLAVPECDLILNGGFFDLRGLTAGVNIDPNWGVSSFPNDLDCETLISGVSFPCMTSTAYDAVNSVIWAVRPMSNLGAVVWLSIDDDDDLSWYSNPTSVYYLALNNMLSFAEAVAGGDPHITTFEDEKFDLNGENIYNLFRDSNLAINVHTKKMGVAGSFIDAVGILFDDHRLHASARAGHLQFFLDDMILTEGSTALNGVVSLSNYVENGKDDLARYLQLSMRLFFNGYTVAVDGGFYESIPFFNVAIKEHHNSELTTRDVSNLGLFQVHSINQLREISDHDSLAEFVVTDLFARD